MAQKSDSPRPRWVSAAPTMAPTADAGFRSWFLSAPPIMGDSSVQLDGVQMEVSAGTLGALPSVTLGAILTFGDKTSEGVIVESVGEMWWHLVEKMVADPEAMYGIGPRQWEEMLAGMLEQEGFKPTLTPPKGDHGRDVIAVREGVGSICMHGQMKAYKPGHRVTADQTRSTLSNLLDPSATKAMLVTTSSFAPRLLDDPKIKAAVPFKLELVDGKQLYKWLSQLAAKKAQR